MTARNIEDSSQDYQLMKAKMREEKDKILSKAIQTVGLIHGEVKETAEIIDKQNEDLDQLNNRLSQVERKATKANLRMEKYLENTSDCKFYIILAIELFIFILLMSL